MWRSLRSRLREPPPPRPARPSPRDTALSLALAAAALTEAALRPRLPLLGPSLAVALGVAASLRWRSVAPLPSLAAAFGLVNVLTALGAARGVRDAGLGVTAAVLIAPWGLLRYASWRDVGAGLGVVLLTWLASLRAGELRDPGDVVGALVVMLFPAALGASARFRDLAHRRDLEHAQLRERQSLARDLHDTVAHRMTAIVLQSRAAAAVASRRPQAAGEALAVIEREAAQGLAELRALVGALREEAPLADAMDLDALEALVRDAGRDVTYAREGDLDGLAPTVAQALHRIAREALHNARRHARGATRIDVSLAGDGGFVRLTVQDDGALAPPVDAGRAGFGLLGMRERARLLGGTLDAGPRPGGGWRVAAVLPREGARA